MNRKPGENHKGLILEIQRMSTEDGPGIRTTVFFKGCSLSCEWCHNPESISPKPQIQWIASRCIGCHSCEGICRQNALKHTKNGVLIDRFLCTGCGECAEECPSTALELLGTSWSVAGLAAEVVKDQAFFASSDGGVTVSGGEPTLQAPFATQFLNQMQQQDIHTALDTCGLTSQKAYTSLLPFTNLVLFDIKIMDDKKHLRHTHAGNKKILKNLDYIIRFIHESGNHQKIWIRTPIIPGATDSEENIRAIGKHLSQIPNDIVDRWELCAFNNLCRDKYIRFGLKWKYDDTELLSQDHMDHLVQVAQKTGFDSELIHATGMTSTQAEYTT